MTARSFFTKVLTTIGVIIAIPFIIVIGLGAFLAVAAAWYAVVGIGLLVIIIAIVVELIRKGSA